MFGAGLLGNAGAGRLGKAGLGAPKAGETRPAPYVGAGFRVDPPPNALLPPNAEDEPYALELP